MNSWNLTQKENFNREPRKTVELVKFKNLLNYYSEVFKPNRLEPTLLQHEFLAKVSPLTLEGLEKPLTTLKEGKSP